MDKGGALLTVRRLGKSFGGLMALNELDLAVERNQVMGLIGPPTARARPRSFAPSWG